MNIVNPGLGATAAQVWAAAARTLTADPATDAGAATFVWTHAARTITSFVANWANLNAHSSALAAGALLDLRPVAGKFRCYSLGEDSATSFQTGFYNGTTFVTNASANTDGATFGFANSAESFACKNADASSHNISYAGVEWS